MTNLSRILSEVPSCDPFPYTAYTLGKNPLLLLFYTLPKDEKLVSPPSYFYEDMSGLRRRNTVERYNYSLPRSNFGRNK